MLEDFSFDSFKEKFKNEKRFKISVIIVGVLISTVLGMFGYYQFVQVPRNEASQDIYVEAMNSTQDFAQKDYLQYEIENLKDNKALETNQVKLDTLENQITRLTAQITEKESNISKQIKLLESNIAEFDGYDGAEPAKYVLATFYMKNSEYDKALNILNELSFEDTFLAAMVPGLKGDCYSNLGEYGEAYSQYAIAYNTNINDFTTPIYLWKAGLVAEKLNQFEEATFCFQNLIDNYSESNFVRNKRIDFYLERAKNSTVQ